MSLNQVESSVVEKYGDSDHTLIRKESRGFKFVIYGITGAGLVTALYRIRPFAKFSNPKQVPSHFLKNQVLLKGKAINIEPAISTTVILVDHKPLINIPRFGKPKYLNVKIAGVNVTSHGISWLSTIVQGNQINLVPVRKCNEYLECTVTMPQENKESLEIGRDLVRLGFGTVEEIQSESKNELISSYEKTLIAAEKWAKFKRNGYWHFTIPATLWWQIKNLIYEKLSLRL